MADGEREPPTAKNRKRLRGVWAELAYLREQIHALWYEQGNKTLARLHQKPLERALKALPENDMAIVRAEGWALLHQMRGEISLAIQWRQREIELIEFLHDDVRRSVAAGNYDERMARSILGHRDEAGLQKRRDILNALMEENTQGGTEL
jgi:hypothetical protein